MTSPAPDAYADLDHFWAVVPAGGAGTRLWPLSRRARPKFLLDLTGSGRTLLQSTVDRLQPLVGERVVVVTGAVHADAVREQLPELPADQVLAEPAPRDSMAAIGWAAAVLELQDPDAVIGSFAADHVIGDLDEFARCVREAVAVASASNRVVTVGIEPTHASTAFGYIRAGDPLEDGPSTAPSARTVREFVEKPDAERAAAYLETGEFRWNAGMFVVRAAALLDLLALWHPTLAEELRAIAADPTSLAERWDGLEKIAIDHAVAEPAAAEGAVAVVPGSFRWDDVGDFDALAGLLPPSGDSRERVNVLGDDELVTAVDATGVVVTSEGSGRRVVLLGVEDVVVVDTGDALLVTTRAHAQDVKSVVDELRGAGLDHLL